MSKGIINNHDVMEGWYGKPRCLIRLVSEKKLTKSEYIFLDLLINFENRYTKFPNEWFFVGDRDFCKTRLISFKSIIKARNALKRKGIIECKQGYSHTRTYYKMCIDGSLYYRGGGASLEKESEMWGALLEKKS